MKFKKKSKELIKCELDNYKNITIKDFMGITEKEERIWMDIAENKIYEAKAFKAWVEGGIRGAKNINKGS